MKLADTKRRLLTPRRINICRNNAGVGGGVGTKPTNWDEDAGFASCAGIGTDSAGRPYVDYRFQGDFSGFLIKTCAPIAYSTQPNDGAYNPGYVVGSTWTASAYLSLAAGVASSFGSVMFGLNEIDGTGGYITNYWFNVPMVTTATPLRCAWTYTLQSPKIARAHFSIGLQGNTSSIGADATIRIAGCQVELGTKATDPIIITRNTGPIGYG